MQHLLYEVLRWDADLLSESGRQMLDHFGSELSAIFADALATAARRGELAANMRVNDAALLLAAIADNAAPITLTEGGFERLEAIYKSLQRMLRIGSSENRFNGKAATPRAVLRRSLARSP